MKRLLTLVLLAQMLTIASCVKVNAQTLQREGWFDDVPLKGNVASVEVVEYFERKGMYKENDGSAIYKFNSSGNVYEARTYYNSGALDSKYVYKYNSLGKIIECAIYDSNGSYSGGTKSKYDSRGNNIEDVNYSGSKIESRVKSIYNSKNQLIESTQYSPSSTVQIKRLYCYDSNGRQIEFIYCDLVNDERYTYSYKHDSYGRVVKCIIYNGNGSIESQAVYRYDSQGRNIEIIRYDGRGVKTGNEKLVYDSRGSLITSTRYSVKDPTGIYSTEYHITYR